MRFKKVHRIPFIAKNLLVNVNYYTFFEIVHDDRKILLVSINFINLVILQLLTEIVIYTFRKFYRPKKMKDCNGNLWQVTINRNTVNQSLRRT